MSVKDLKCSSAAITISLISMLSNPQSFSVNDNLKFDDISRLVANEHFHNRSKNISM